MEPLPKETETDTAQADTGVRNVAVIAERKVKMTDRSHHEKAALVAIDQSPPNDESRKEDITRKGSRPWSTNL